jgi:hypothetical protein
VRGGDGLGARHEETQSPTPPVPRPRPPPPAARSYEELAGLAVDPVSNIITSSELMDLAIALGVTPSAPVFWRTHRTTDDLISAIFDKTSDHEENVRAADAEAEAAHIQLMNARSQVAIGAPSAATAEQAKIKVLKRLQSFTPVMGGVDRNLFGARGDQTDSILLHSRQGR